MSIQRITTRIERIACMESIPELELATCRENYEFDAVFDHALRRTLIALKYYLQAGENVREEFTTVSYPADWVQALKLRWFPAWLKRRYPTRMTEVKICVKYVQRVCPHLPTVDGRKGPWQRDHLLYLGGISLGADDKVGGS